MKSEFDELSVLRKIVKYVVYSSNKKIEKKLFFFIQVARLVFGLKEF
jgi:hypothetical protein